MKKRKQKRLLAVIAAVGVAAGVMVVSPSVVAHGTCSPFANAPIRDGGSITGSARITCNDQHAKYHIEIVLQKQAGDGSWNTIDTETDLTFNTDTGTAAIGWSCSSGTWRSRIKVGKVFNSSNVQVHPDPPDVYIDNSTGNSISC